MSVVMYLEAGWGWGVEDPDLLIVVSDNVLWKIKMKS